MAQTISTQDTFILTGRIDRAVHKHALSHSSGSFQNYENDLLIKVNDLARNEVQMLSGLYMIDGTIIENTDVVSIPATSNGTFKLVSDLDLSANTITTYLTTVIQYDDDLTLSPQGRKQLELATVVVQNGTVATVTRTIPYLETNWWNGLKNWVMNNYYSRIFINEYFYTKSQIANLFYSKTESDNRYLNKTGDTATGPMTFTNSAIGLDLKPNINSGRYYMTRGFIGTNARYDFAIDETNMYLRARSTSAVKNIVTIPDNGPITFSQGGLSSAMKIGFATTTTEISTNQYLIDTQEYTIGFDYPISTVEKLDFYFQYVNDLSGMYVGQLTDIRPFQFGKEMVVHMNEKTSTTTDVYKRFIITSTGKIQGKTLAGSSGAATVALTRIVVTYKNDINLYTN